MTTRPALLRTTVAILTAAFLAAITHNSLLHARGEGHAPSAEEKNFHTAVVVPALKAIKQAMPPAPKGWIIESETPIKTDLPEQVTADPGSLQCSYTVTYKRATDVINETLRLDQAYEQSRKRNMEAANAQIVKLKKKKEEIEQELDTARRNKSSSREKKLAKQLDDIEKRIQAVSQEADQKIRQETEKYLVKDTKVVVRISLNDGSAEFPSGGKGFTRPRAAFALRKEGTREGEKGWNETQTLILYGDWQEVQKNKFVARLKDIPYWNRVQTVSVAIIGDRARTETFITKMDMKSILGMMKQ